MSTWSSVGADPLRALNIDGDAANYRAEGEHGVQIDIATTSHHALVRLALWDDRAVGEAVLVTAEAARNLARRLEAAADRAERPGSS